MRVIIQRVSQAEVAIDDSIAGCISSGLLILLSIEDADSTEDADWLCKKILSMRIFNDADGKMNLSCADINGDYLVVSQFTLHASTQKGNRPSFIKAARPEKAIPLYEYFISTLQQLSGKTIQTGRFGADMKVSLINDGPVTIWMDSKARE